MVFHSRFRGILMDLLQWLAFLGGLVCGLLAGSFLGSVAAVRYGADAAAAAAAGITIELLGFGDDDDEGGE